MREMSTEQVYLDPGRNEKPEAKASGSQYFLNSMYNLNQIWL